MENHILLQHGKEWTNVAIFEAPLSWSEAIRNNMWELKGNARSLLYIELRN